jgi:hypothetical protein
MSSVPQLVVVAAQAHGVDPELALAVATAESGRWWQNNLPVPNSSAGAIGVMQLEPATAAELGVDPYDAAQNIDGGVRYLGGLLAQFGDPMAAVAAYDWGEGNVTAAIAEYGGSNFTVTSNGQTMPAWLASAPAETRSYVQKILGGFPAISMGPAAGTGPGPAAATAPAGPAPDWSSFLPPASGDQGSPAILLWAGLGLFALWLVSEVM